MRHLAFAAGIIICAMGAGLFAAIPNLRIGTSGLSCVFLSMIGFMMSYYAWEYQAVRATKIHVSSVRCRRRFFLGLLGVLVAVLLYSLCGQQQDAEVYLAVGNLAAVSIATTFFNFAPKR